MASDVNKEIRLGLGLGLVSLSVTVCILIYTRDCLGCKSCALQMF